MFDDPYWLAFWITAVATLASTVALDAPVRRLLRHATGSAPHSDLWIATYRVTVPLVATFGYCFGTTFVNAATGFGRPQPTVAFICLWSFGGLTAAILVAAVTASSLGGAGRVVYVEQDLADDLDRLLVRVERIRARRVLRFEPGDERRPA